MAVTDTNRGRAAERGCDARRRRRLTGRPERMAGRLARIRQALQTTDRSALSRAAKEIAQALGCAVVITHRDGDEAVGVAQERLSGLRPEATRTFLRQATQRLAGRRRALSLTGGGNEAHGLPSGRYYLGLPAPRRTAAGYAIHLFSPSAFSPAQKRAARAAADWLGRWAAGAEAAPEIVSQETAAPHPAPEVGGVAIEQLLSDAMRAAAETLGADTCSLMVLDEASNALVVDTAYGLAEGILRDPGRRPGEGIASYVMSLGRPVILDDPRQDPRLRGLAIEPRPDIRCSICVPIELSKGFSGVVSFNRTDNAEPFTQDDLQLAHTVASQLGPCVANARLYQQAAERLGEMTAISRMAEFVTPGMDVRAVARLLAASIAQSVGIQRCRIYLDQGGSLWLAAQRGHPAGATAQSPLEGEAIARAVAERCPVILDHREGAGAGAGATDAAPPCRAVAALPLVCRGRVLGAFCAQLADHERSNDLNLGLLEKVLARAAVTLDDAAAQQRLRENFDDLYRLYDAVQRVNTSFEPEDILKQVIHEVKLLTGCRRAGFAPLTSGREAIGRADWGSMVLRLAADSGVIGTAQSITAPLLIKADSGVDSIEMTELAAELRRLTGGDRALIVPLAHEQGSLGLLVGWNLSREPKEREISLAAGLCAHGAALLRKAIEYHAAISQRSLELSALYQLCEEISTATSFESALRSVLEIAHSMVDYDEGLVFIWSGEGGRLELAACRGVDFDAASEQAPQVVPGNMYRWVFQEGKAFISTDIGQLGGEGSALRSAMAVPLVVGNEPIGVLAIHSARPRAYGEEHVKVLSIVASQAAAIYRALQSLGSLSRYTENILQSIVAGVIGLDRSGGVVMWSPAAERILGLGAAEATGADLPGLARRVAGKQGAAPGGSLESLAAVARRVLADGEPVLEQELRLEPPGAPPRVLLASCTPLRSADAELMGAVLLVEDVTERRRMDERMRQMSQLAAVGHLAANVAHEIRNPLSAIKTAAQFLSSEYGSEELIAQFAGIIDEECDRLGKVATDFLTYARPTEPDLRRVSLIAVVESALAAAAPEMAQRSITMEWQPPRGLPRVWADPDAMRQVLVNLLLNAAQAIVQDGQVTVAVNVARDAPGGRSVEVVVSDTGPGIPPGQIERIWTPFFSTKTKGTGLGLSIVRKTVEAHGGQIWAESGRPGGASFHLRLPCARGNAAHDPCASARVAAGAQAWRQLELFEHHPTRHRHEAEPAATARHGGQT